MMFRSGLPVDSIAEAICDEIGKKTFLIVTANTGSGKSTVLPLAIRSKYPEKRIVMLEPRRITARAVAVRMAQLLCEKIGQHVGFRTRFETNVSADTEIEIVTEGILTRILQDNPALDGYDIVIFDEYHERTMQGDLALTLTMEALRMFRPDLTIIIMSATLDTDSIAGFFGGHSESFHAPGRLFSVEVSYCPPKLPFFHPQGEHDFLHHMALVISDAVMREQGNLLVFLPGEPEIHRLSKMLRTDSVLNCCEIMELYGNLSPQKQDAVFHHTSASCRRIVIATPVAETGITIPDIRIVVDSGLVRRPFFSPATGINKLRTVRISKASAEQRKGRAGRTANGICYRLWSMQEQNAMDAQSVPEILQSDLTDFVLDLAKWGIPCRDVLSLPWITPPPKTNLSYAYDILTEIDAVTADGLLSEYGSKLHEIPVHPRLAHACLFATDAFGSFESVLWLVALIEEKDILPECREADLRLRLSAIEHPDDSNVNGDTLQRIKLAQMQIAKALHIVKYREKSSTRLDYVQMSIALSAAFPDRIARRRDQDSRDYVLSSGVIAHLRKEDTLQMYEYLVVADLGGILSSPTIFSALPLNIDSLHKYLPRLFKEEHILYWDADSRIIRACNQIRIGRLAVERKNANVMREDNTSSILIDVIRKSWPVMLPFSARARMLLARMCFLARCGFEQFGRFSEKRLLDELESWLGPYLAGLTSIDQLKKISFYDIFDSMLSPAERAFLRKEAPESFRAPSGSNFKIDYTSTGQPLVHVKLQELFGLTHAPKLASGRSSIAFDLLSPAMRTVQITSDIDAFWDGSYALVRKDMRSRYPKHNWPENPREEPPSRYSIKRH